MPTLTPQQLRLLCHKRVARRKAGSSARLEARVAQLVKQNVDGGRFERLNAARARPRALTLTEYVDRVIEHVLREDARVQALEQGDEGQWNRLRELFYRRACRKIQPYRSGDEANTAAWDFAQQACLVVFEAPYPFDVAFEAWATTILNNLVLAHYTRSPDALNRLRPADSLDSPHPTEDGSDGFLGDLLANPHSLVPFEKIENLETLLKAVNQLSSHAQRRVIIATFLEELDDAQIAEELGRGRQAIYNLRKRALGRLKQILGENGTQDLGSQFHNNR